eukprot:9214402-Alexandrium_andersonii.AAC.1
MCIRDSPPRTPEKATSALRGVVCLGVREGGSPPKGGRATNRCKPTRTAANSCNLLQTAASVCSACS